MKKKHRDIIVNDTKYVWKAGNINCDGDGSLLIRIYHNNKEKYSELINPNIKVTPKYIRELILTKIIA